MRIQLITLLILYSNMIIAQGSYHITNKSDNSCYRVCMEDGEVSSVSFVSFVDGDTIVAVLSHEDPLFEKYSWKRIFQRDWSDFYLHSLIMTHDHLTDYLFYVVSIIHEGLLPDGSCGKDHMTMSKGKNTIITYSPLNAVFIDLPTDDFGAYLSQHLIHSLELVIKNHDIRKMTFKTQTADVVYELEYTKHRLKKVIVSYFGENWKEKEIFFFNYLPDKRKRSYY